jgi:hypothetical protein
MRSVISGMDGISPLHYLSAFQDVGGRRGEAVGNGEIKIGCGYGLSQSRQGSSRRQDVPLTPILTA